MLIHLSMAARMLQWQSWVTNTETVCTTKPRTVTVWLFIGKKKLPSPGLTYYMAPCFVQEGYKEGLGGAWAAGFLGLSVTSLVNPLLPHFGSHFRGTKKLAFPVWPGSIYDFRCSGLYSNRQKGHLSAKLYFFPLCSPWVLSRGNFLKAKRTSQGHCVTCQSGVFGVLKNGF